MAFMESWVETDPDGSVITVSLLDDHVRLKARAVRERIEGDPAVLGSGLYEAGTFGTTAMVKKGVARAFTVTDANLTTTYLQDGRLAVNLDNNTLYHSRASGLVTVKIKASDILSGAPPTFTSLTVTPGVSSLQAVTATTITTTGEITSGTNLTAAATSVIRWTGRASLDSPADGSVRFMTAAFAPYATLSTTGLDVQGEDRAISVDASGSRRAGLVKWSGLAPKLGYITDAFTVSRVTSGTLAAMITKVDVVTFEMDNSVTFLSSTAHRNGLRLEAATADATAPRIQSYSSKTLYINELGNPIDVNGLPTFRVGVVVSAGNLTVSTGTTAVQAITATSIAASSMALTSTVQIPITIASNHAGGTGIELNNTAGSSRGSFVALNQGGVRRGGISVSGVWLGSFASDIAVFCDTGSAFAVYTNGSSTAGLSIATTNAATFTGNVIADGDGMFRSANAGRSWQWGPDSGGNWRIAHVGIITPITVAHTTGDATFSGFVRSDTDRPFRSTMSTRDWRSGADGSGNYTITQNGVISPLSFAHTTGVATFAANVTVTTGGLTVTAGGLTVSAGTTTLQAITGTTLALSSSLQVGGGATVTGILTGSVSWDPASIAHLNVASTTCTVTGAAVGDPCFVQSQFPGNTQMIVTCVVTSANTVTLYVMNHSGGNLDPTGVAVTFKVVVFKV